MSPLRDEAGALIEALDFGLCNVGEVIAWSDAPILRLDDPPGILCEVSLAHRAYPQDLARLLRELSGEADDSRAMSLLNGLLAHALMRDPDPSGPE